MSEPPQATMRWSVEQRLAFIERRLFWDSQINRADLIHQFSISVPQASADLAHYDQIAPGNMEYSPHLKTYVATAGFKPHFELTARQYLTQLLLLADDVVGPEESWLGRRPPTGIFPRIRRKLEANVLRQILIAIRNRQTIQVTYQSMSAEVPSPRWISPHALGFDGHRWHVRAWCERRGKFLDFVFARILQIGDLRPSDIDPAKDSAWHQFACVRLGPNPQLSAAQQRIIELDYGMQNGCIEVELRLCHVYYFARQFLLDVAESLRPERVQIVLLNREELNDSLRLAGEETI